MHSINRSIVCIRPRSWWCIGDTLLELSAALTESRGQHGRRSKESLGQVPGGRDHGEQDGMVGAERVGTKCSLLHSARSFLQDISS